MNETGSTIDYDSMVQDALRGVVRRILTETERDGLVGEHHFYIAFKTQVEGVDIPSRLLDRFPEEMTIVLQNRFWDLKVSEDRFQVGLSFIGQPELLTVPFDAIVGFVDPSVRFALQFHDGSEVSEDEADDTIAADFPGAEDAGEGIHDAFFHAQRELEESEKAENEAASDTTETDQNDKSGKPGGENVVVALDAFRKK